MKNITSHKIDSSIKEGLAKLGMLNFDYYVVGGLLCQYYLKEHARYTKDIDILFDADFNIVEEELKRVFGDNIDFTYHEETDYFYEPTFTCFIYLDNLRVQLEGKRINFFNKIKSEQYSYEGITFNGVCIEYVIAEKNITLLSELHRPYKHLVDIYSFSQIDQSLINKREVKRYMELINNQENIYRLKVGLKEYHLPTQIPDNKRFNPPMVLPTLQAQYNLSFKEIINSVNKWLINIT